MKRQRRTRERYPALAGSMMELANAINAWRPLFRGTLTGLVSCTAGWLTSELPFWAIGMSALRLARASLRGQLRGAAGLATIAATGSSWFILAQTHRRATRSRVILERALDTAVGPEPTKVWTPSGIELAPSRRTRLRRQFVTAEHTLAYGDAGRPNLLDIWSHRDLPLDAKAPVLLQVPGGAWMAGGRRGQAYPLLGHMASAGWVCVSMSYRQSPRHAWPAHIEDVKRVLAWIKHNIAEHGGDPDFVAITGGSAGGHLAALAALTADDKSLQPGHETDDLRVAAAVPIYGRYDWTDATGPTRRGLVRMIELLVVQRRIAAAQDVFRDASPLHRIRADAPPFFVLHGDADTVIPVEEARAFVGALRAGSRAPVAYAELPGAQHGFDILNSPRAVNCARAVHRFLDTVYAARQAETGS